MCIRDSSYGAREPVGADDVEVLVLPTPLGPLAVPEAVEVATEGDPAEPVRVGAVVAPVVGDVTVGPTVGPRAGIVTGGCQTGFSSARKGRTHGSSPDDHGTG